LRIENAATRSQDRVYERFIAGDVDAARSLYADDFRWEDRRRGLRYDSTSADDGFDASVRSFAELGVASTRFTSLAVRGDRLALVRAHMTTRERYEIELIIVVEVSPDGRFLSVVTLDADALAEAAAELDGRFLGAGNDTPTLRLMVAYVNAYNSRDALQLQDLQADDFRMVDHRPAGAGELDRDAARQYVETLWELLPRFCMYAERIVRLDSDGGLLTLRTVAETADGGPIEIHVAVLAKLDGDGSRVRRFEIFAIEELAAAERRYDELMS